MILLRRFITSLFFISLFIAELTVAVAQDNDNSEKTTATVTEKTPSIEAQTARALRIGFVDGILRFVKGAARTRIQLEWEPLPVDETIIKAARKHGNSPVSIIIRNEDLVDGKWRTKISAKDKKMLQEALGLADLNNIDNSDSTLKQFWSLTNPTVRDLFRSKSLEASDYFGLIRDRNILITLLQSNGISYSFSSEELGVSSQNIRISDEKINWHITVYKFTIKQQPEVAFYRFAVKALVEPFDIIIPKTVSSKTSVKLKGEISFKQSDKNIGLLDDVTNILFEQEEDIIIEPPKQELINQLNVNNATSKLEGLLTFAGGSTQLGEVVSQGLLGGTQNTSIVSGGLVDFADAGISPLVGVNQKIGQLSDVSAGLLFGIGLSDKTSLFIGPSLQASIFTLSVGGLALEGERDPEIHIAGVISVDLSRLTGSKQTINKIDITNRGIGGNWGVASGEIYSNLTLLEWTFNSSDKQFRDFRLRQVCNSKGIALRSEEQFSLKMDAGNTKVIQFIPKGIYKYEGIPEGFQLKSINNNSIIAIVSPINPDTNEFDMRENYLTSVTWQAVQTQNQETGSISSSKVTINNGENKDESFCQQVISQKNAHKTK